MLYGSGSLLTRNERSGLRMVADYLLGAISERYPHRSAGYAIYDNKSRGAIVADSSGGYAVAV